MQAGKACFPCLYGIRTGSGNHPAGLIMHVFFLPFVFMLVAIQEKIQYTI